MFSPDQIQELLSIVDRYHVVFLAQQVGTDILSTEDKDLLKHHGFKLDSFSKEGKFEEMFKFGLISAALKDEHVKKMNYSDFKKFLSSQDFLPLTTVEKEALNSIKAQAYSDIKRMSTRVCDDLTNTFVETDKKLKIKYQKIIGKESYEAIYRRKTTKQLASTIAKKSGNWARDFDRISDFIMHQAFDEGRAFEIMKRYGVDAQVYKSVLPGACEHCIRLYLTGGVGSKPRIFKLRDLIENGTNIGKKVREWRAVLGSTHVWCRCQLMKVPIGLKWSDKERSFSEPKQIKLKVKTKIKIGDKEL